MADDNTLTQESGTGEDSSVIKVLRQRVKELEKELQRRPDPETVEAEVARRVARREAATSVLVQMGFSPKMSDLVTREVEGDITEESVRSFLEGLGLKADSGQPTDDGAKQSEKASQVAEVADLASQVASVTQSDGTPDITKAISEAKSVEELDAIMRKAGLAG